MERKLAQKRSKWIFPSLLFWMFKKLPPVANGQVLIESPSKLAYLLLASELNLQEPMGNDCRRFVIWFPLEEWACVWVILSVTLICQTWGTGQPWLLWFRQMRGEESSAGEWTRGWTRGTRLHGECAATWLTQCIDPWKTTHILRDFYRDFKVEKARAAIICPSANYFHVIATTKREKWLLMLISAKTDFKIRCLCIFLKLIFYVRGLKPAILLYYLSDNLPYFLRFSFFLLGLSFIKRQ